MRDILNITQSIQNYLKAIYTLSEQGEPVSTTALATHLGVTSASVTGMIQKISAASSPLLTYRKHQGVQLTDIGRKAALEVIRRHRLLETFLVTKLGYSWDEVHAEAEQLQHAVSNLMVERMDGALEYPSRDPHGELIPRPDLSLPVDHSLPLLALRPPQRCTLFRVNDSNPWLLVHLEKNRLLPGTRMEVKDFSTFDQNLTLLIEGQEKPIVIGAAISSRIFVVLDSKQENTKD
jgi:DtxR family Mn-dependent transcriptional regulator